MTVPGYAVRHSGVRWLCEDGHLCNPGEIVASLNVGLARTSGPRDAPHPFGQEESDLQVALATPIGGCLRQAPNVSFGGFVDQHDVIPWMPDFIIGTIEPTPGQTVAQADGELRLLVTAGRRTTELTRRQPGLTSRAWRVENDRPIGTLLSLGICELDGVIKGERFAFEEILDSAEGPAQVVFVPDEALVPNSRILAEQIRRTDAERTAIAEDLAKTFTGGAVTPSPADWIFAGAVLGALQRSPTTDRHQILTRNGLRTAGPPNAIVLSLRAEGRTILRHRRLGYTFHCHNYRLAGAGPAILAWLRANFEPVSRSLDDVRADYRALIDLIRAHAPATQVLIHNVMSTSGYEDIQTYAAFDAPLGQSLLSVHDKQLNLMLQDLARERDIAIIDADAIAAELGGRLCFTSDAVHQNGLMQEEVRGEILWILSARGVPGFSTTPIN
jgi:hypothetical protein